MPKTTALVWFRNDLRLADNPALAKACETADEVVALYVHEADAALRSPGGATRYWLHNSLQSLSAGLSKLGIDLLVRSGKAQACVEAAVKETGAGAVHWNRRYAPAERDVDATIKAALRDDEIDAQSYPGSVLVEPWDIATKQGKPYSVYTPFWNALKTMNIARPSAAPKPVAKQRRAARVDTDYSAPRWSDKLASHWHIGEAAAQKRLEDFLEHGIDHYVRGRDTPGDDETSRLSPHLRFGEISPRQIWHAAMARSEAEHGKAQAIAKFLSELGWRDFNYHQLYHRQDIAKVPMQAKFAGMKWRRSEKDFDAWTAGRTGFPIVDAGMRQLWQTGFMHNRVRMLVASILCKNLMLDWHAGEEWFWDTLVDADVANNPANWQWVAGSGNDASPYFRIFNPVTQGERFDGDGRYVRQWVPELSSLPDKWIHQPFSAPKPVLDSAGVVLGETYPHPIVDLGESREQALAAYKALPAVKAG